MLPMPTVAVVVIATPVTGDQTSMRAVRRRAFDRVAGSMPELRRGSQGEFEERLPERSSQDFNISTGAVAGGFSPRVFDRAKAKWTSVPSPDDQID
jgi:hypothetical protein